MSARKPGPEGEPNRIDFALNQIEIDTLKAGIAPTPEQYRALTDKVLSLDLGRGYAKASQWEKYSADVEVLLVLLPKKDSKEVLAKYYGLKAQKYYRKQIWDEYYNFVLGYFHNQAAKHYPASEEKAFWEACFGKYLEITFKYKDLMP